MSNDMNKVLALDNLAMEGSYIKQSQQKSRDLLEKIDNKHKKFVWAKDYFYKEVSYMNENELKIVPCRLPESMNIGIEVDKKLDRSVIFDKFLSQYPELSKFKRK